jgi:hypothetical protein
MSSINIPYYINIGYICYSKFFFFFFDMFTQEGGGIRTSDLRFMKRGLQPIELLIGGICYSKLN